MEQLEREESKESNQSDVTSSQPQKENCHESSPQPDADASTKSDEPEANRKASAKPNETSEAGKPVKDSKIIILLKPVGDAPILKQKNWSVAPEKTIASIIQFVRQYLKMESSGSLFLFVNQSFSPSPDQTVKNLFDCFGSENKLILHYSTTVAWG